MSVALKDVDEYLWSLINRVNVLQDDLENLSPVFDCLENNLSERLPVTKRRQCDFDLRSFATSAYHACDFMREILKEARKHNDRTVGRDTALVEENSKLNEEIASLKKKLESMEKKK